jgi:hypothetical protein
VWLYNGKEFTEDQIGDAFGYVYLISNIKDNRYYIGKKFFTKASRKQVKGKTKKIRVNSDWMSYWGSNKTVQEDVHKLGVKFFKREILYLCKTRSECSYYESLEIFTRGALIKVEYYNDWISCRIRKAHLKNLII